MPRAQRTKSAVHEALQRRVDERPGDSFSGLLGGLSTFVPLAPCASYAAPQGPPLWCGRCSGTALARFSAAPATGGKFAAASGQFITEQSNYRTARLRETPCLFAISHLRAAGAAAATHLQFTEHGVDPTFFSLSANIPDRLTAMPLSCAEATHAEGAADEVRCARGASAPGRQTARRQLQRLVGRRHTVTPSPNTMLCS
jgi:hypothetical protein